MTKYGACGYYKPTQDQCPRACAKCDGTVNSPYLEHFFFALPISNTFFFFVMFIYFFQRIIYQI